MVKPNRLAYWAVTVGLFLASLMGEAVAADRYIGLYGGLTIPERLQDVRGIESSSGVNLTDLKLARSAISGAKLGFFRSPKSSLGFETEFFYTNAHMKQQDIPLSAAFPTTTSNYVGAQAR